MSENGNHANISNRRNFYGNFVTEMIKDLRNQTGDRELTQRLETAQYHYHPKDWRENIQGGITRAQESEKPSGN